MRFAKECNMSHFQKIIWLTVIFSQAFRESILDIFKEMSLCFVSCVLKYSSSFKYTNEMGLTINFCILLNR